MRVLRNLALVLLLVAPLGTAAAQGCAMCKTSAEAAAAEQQKALNHGILVLAIPSVVIFGGISIFAVRYRASSSARQSQREKGQDTGLL
jgi:heme/copper-type cytochrome/quinol oxidase subunit 2